MKKTLLTILLSGIIFTSIGATAAYVYTARDINYQPSDEDWSVNNVQEALTELKTDVNTITNKVDGIERVYKAGEVELVALVSDDSFYTDSNGKYVLSNSNTGRTLLADTSTYKSLPSTSDCVGIVGADVVEFFDNSSILVNLADCIIHHSGGQYRRATDIYNSTNDITIINNIQNATSSANIDTIDLTITFNTKRKVKLLINAECEQSADRSQTLTLTVKHNSDNVYSNNIYNTGKFNVSNIYDIDADANDTLSVKLNSSYYYNYSNVSITLF